MFPNAVALIMNVRMPEKVYMKRATPATVRVLEPLLLADSGSTKTDWLLCVDGARRRFQTTGMNPFLMSDEVLEQTLSEALAADIIMAAPSRVYFWGAGCRDAGAHRMKRALHALFPGARVRVESDLVGAAYALFGSAPGIACILGTGSNSGIFDGRQLVANIPPLGYLLGDEGSGASLGKHFLNVLLKGELPQEISSSFYASYATDAGRLLHDVYHSPSPNSYLAQFAPFLHTMRHRPEIRDLLLDEFTLFFRKNVCPYHRPDLPVGFVGSIASHFSEELHKAAENLGFTVGCTLQKPLEAFLTAPDRLPEID